MQNRPEELWPLFNLITRGHFREKEDFKNHFVGPIRRSLKAGASEEARALGSRRKDELQGVLGRYLLQRSKEVELGSQLKGKREIVVFCDLSPLQKQLYLHLLSLPDFNNVRIGSLPCPCGSGCIRYCIYPSSLRSMYV
jgi:DNA repair and recombination RAD54-like protein